MDECCNESCINELLLDKCKYDSNKIKCPACLHGWQRDIVVSIDKDGNEETQDIECGRCGGSGWIYKERLKY